MPTSELKLALEIVAAAHNPQLGTLAFSKDGRCFQLIIHHHLPGNMPPAGEWVEMQGPVDATGATDELVTGPDRTDEPTPNA